MKNSVNYQELNESIIMGKNFMGGKTCSISDANNNGTRFYEFLNLKEYALLDTSFQHKHIHTDTWNSNTGTQG